MSKSTNTDPNSIFTYENGRIYSKSNSLKGRWKKGEQLKSYGVTAVMCGKYPN